MKKKKNLIRNLLYFIWTAFILVFYYMTLPAINVHSLASWLYVLIVFSVYGFISLITDINVQNQISIDEKNLGRLVGIIIGVVVIYFGGMLAVSPIFNAKSYTERIVINTSDFAKDIKEVDFENLPLLDKDSARKVGDRVVGQASDLVSQFSVSDEYTLINYKGSIVRVTPLEHNGLFKYLNHTSGTAGYVIVDTTTGEAKLVRSQQGLKYLPSAYFFDNLTRYVRVHYPFAILGDYSFELDEQGTPYWVISTMTYSWIGVKPRVNGVIVLNAISGDITKYDLNDVPTWIDNVYYANLVIDEVDSWGTYKGGYFNSIFAQKDVVNTTDGYTYVTMDDDVYLYTGITSISSDESNIGFVMVNLRTHEANYYAVPGAEEYSAMDSAAGAVQEKNYISTFPLLINLNGRATYLLSLKDAAGLVKMYGFVDVSNYQKVSVTDASLGIRTAAANYLNMMGVSEYNETDLMSKEVTVKEINTVVVNGNTWYYILAANGEKLAIEASVDLSITPFIKENDQLTVDCYNSTKDLFTVVNITNYHKMVTED